VLQFTEQQLEGTQAGNLKAQRRPANSSIYHLTSHWGDPAIKYNNQLPHH